MTALDEHRQRNADEPVPGVNSYQRFWDAGQFAPSIINWGMDNKTCTVLLSAHGRRDLYTEVLS
jgi:glutamine synthetase